MLLCMRTTVDLDEGLLKQAKSLAVQTGTTLTAVIEEALREKLARPPEKAAKKRKVRIEVYGSGGPAPGIDFDDNASVRAFLDEGLPIEKLR